MRLWIVGLAVLLMRMLVIVFGEEVEKVADAYTPLTYQEVHNWLMTITYPDLLDFIIKYDVVENAVPKVTPAKKLILIENRDLLIVK
jgi:hypothetical protein